ncbi:hypothetical protein [Streptomyces profundus]|uniref:hypothetical protein n=1 Tax=Streptomyces profundus TaxID=2867410 RepID=UPI001D15F1EF|nr:hypothetical protein [Streptomyces sp. MA3_2.13]UED86284.1 hypothetical protein K4G22_20520 [Streptomyces sp. MA3_2.13]
MGRRSKLLNEHEFIARLDGAERVSVNVVTDGRLLVAIGYEFGYRLDEIRGGTSFTLVFLRDDSEEARRRAGWTTRLYRTHGAWWDSCWPPAVRHLPDTVTPAEAGAARIAVHRFRRAGTSPTRAILLIGGVVALMGAGHAHETPPLALSLVALAVALLAVTPAAARRILTAHSRQLAIVERFENQRHHPPPHAPEAA